MCRRNVKSFKLKNNERETFLFAFFLLSKEISLFFFIDYNENEKLSDGVLFFVFRNA